MGKPETFDFLGFIHCCSTNRSGGFQILRMTVKKRMRATLQSIRIALNRRRHEPVQVVGRFLGSIIGGYFNYHAVPGNLLRLDGFRVAVCRLWQQAFKRRSQRNRLQWSRYGRLPTSIYHDPEPLIPTQKNASRHVLETGAICVSSARTDLCGGGQVTAIPTATDCFTSRNGHIFDRLQTSPKFGRQLRKAVFSIDVMERHLCVLATSTPWFLPC